MRRSQLVVLIFAFSTIPLLSCTYFSEVNPLQILIDVQSSYKTQYCQSFSQNATYCAITPTTTFGPTITAQLPITNTPNYNAKPQNATPQLAITDTPALTTDTPIPATNTRIPATKTLIPPTNTSIPPTNTPIPPTDVPAPKAKPPLQPTYPLPPVFPPTATMHRDTWPTPMPTPMPVPTP